MKIRIALLSAAVTLLACGEDLSSHEFTSGTYALSEVTLASQNDECGLLGAYTDPAKRIGITVNDTAVTFNLSNSDTAAPESLDQGVLEGNVITQNSPTDYTVAFGDTCVVRINRTITGDVTGDNKAALTMDFSVSVNAGDCTDTAFAAVPCASTYQFTATKL